jgi:sigma-E factor negative regulatory protein RseA
MRCFAQAAFARRFAERLAAEPTVLAPGSVPVNPFGKGRANVQWSDAIGARPWYYGLAAAASIAAVGLVGWFGAQEFSLGPALSEQAAISTMGTMGTSKAGFAAGGTGGTIAVNAQATAAMGRRSQVPTLDPYLLVHQEYSPTTAMQGVRPYVRTVADIAATE